MAATSPKTVTIIGGGFSGTALAIHMMRQHAGNSRDGRLQINLVEKNIGSIFGGAAYGPGKNGTAIADYTTNIAFSRMSLFPGDTDDCSSFLAYVKGLIDQGRFRDTFANLVDLPNAIPEGVTDQHLKDITKLTPSNQIPRWLYRIYLKTRYDEAVRMVKSAHSTSAIAVVEGEATDIDISGSQRRVIVNGRSLASDAVVLATGHFSPIPKGFLAGDPADFEGDPNYIGDSVYDTDKLLKALQGKNKTVFIAGMGLTAEDVILAAYGNGRGFLIKGSGNKILAYSRNGQFHRPLDPKKAKNTLKLDIEAFLARMRKNVTPGYSASLQKFVIAEWKELDKKYNGPAIADAFRPHTEKIKQCLMTELGFTKEQIDALLTDAMSALNANVTVSSERSFRIMEKLRKQGLLVRGAGAIKSVKRIAGGKFEITIEGKTTPVVADVFVDATGRSESISALTRNGSLPTLFQNLIRKGLVTSLDEGKRSERGIKVNTERQILDKDDKVVEGLYAIGVPAAGAAVKEGYVGAMAFNVPGIVRNIDRVASLIIRQIGLRSRTYDKDYAYETLYYRTLRGDPALRFRSAGTMQTAVNSKVREDRLMRDYAQRFKPVASLSP